MRTRLLAAGAAAALSAGILVATTGVLDSGALGGASLGTAASGTDSSVSIHVQQNSAADYPVQCQVIITFEAGDTEGLRRYVYNNSDSEIVLGGKNGDQLPAPTYGTSSSVALLLVKGTSFDVAAYAEYSGGRHSTVAHLGLQQVTC